MMVQTLIWTSPKDNPFGYYYELSIWWDDSVNAKSYVTACNMELVNEVYAALQKATIALHDVMELGLDDVPESALPLRLTMPFTKVCVEILDEFGEVPEFNLPNKTFEFKGKWFQLGKMTFTIVRKTNNFYVTDSENLHYNINDEYKLGSEFIPIHKMALSELSLDFTMFIVAIGLTSAMKDLGLARAAPMVATKLMTGLSSVSLKTQFQSLTDDIKDSKNDVVNSVTTETAKLALSTAALADDMTNLLNTYSIDAPDIKAKLIELET